MKQARIQAALGGCNFTGWCNYEPFPGFRMLLLFPISPLIQTQCVTEAGKANGPGCFYAESVAPNQSGMKLLSGTGMGVSWQRMQHTKEGTVRHAYLKGCFYVGQSRHTAPLYSNPRPLPSNWHHPGAFAVGPLGNKGKVLNQSLQP